MASLCPFARLIPQLSVAPSSSPNGIMNGTHGGVTDAVDTPNSKIPLPSPISLPSGVATPSFAPNVESDHIPAKDVTVPTLIAAVSHQPVRPNISVDDIDLPDQLDLSLPISELLKVGTQRAHQDAEGSEGAKQLIKGMLGLEEYIRWNAILWRVYEVLAQFAMNYGIVLSDSAISPDNPVLSPTYDPRTLARAPTLAQDIAYLLTLLPSSSAPSTIPISSITNLHGPLPPFPLPPFLLPIFTEPPAPLATYLSHIASLASSSTAASALLAHAYVRYLGDMSGGQFIAARIRRSYQLRGSDGLRFYHFDQEGRSAEELESEGGGEARKRLGGIKDWYRRGMNEGVGEDKELKTHLVKEANLAFSLNTHLFSLIRPSPISDLNSPVNDSTPTSPVSPTLYTSQSNGHQPQKSHQVLSGEINGKTQITAGTPGASAAAKKQGWREIVERLVLAALAVIVGQVIARFGIPWLQQQPIGQYLGIGKR